MVENDIGVAFQRWVEPSAGERETGRQALLEVLTTGATVTLQDVFDLALTTAGLPPNAVNTQVTVRTTPDGSFDFDSDAEPFKAHRMQTAMLEALSDLLSTGNVQRVVHNGNNPDARIGVQVGNTGTGAPVRLHRPFPNGDGFRLHRRLLDDPRLLALDPDRLTADLDALVGPRGTRCLREAISCYRVSEFLAAAMMLGAAHEAAWYRLANLLVSGDGTLVDLSAAIDGNWTARVMNLSCDAFIARLPKRRHREVAQLRAQAEMMLNVRNYGLHPRDDSDAALEDQFTELGCTALLVTNRHFLVRLRDLAKELGLIE